MMLPLQVTRCLLHPAKGNVARWMPSKLSSDCLPVFVQHIPVGPRNGVSRIKMGFARFDIENTDILRQHSVQCILKSPCIKTIGALKTGDLSQGMHARIGSARACDWNFLRSQGVQSLFDLLLYRTPV